MTDTVREIVHQGWLTKSPPLERPANAFFKAKWRRRWFVLQAGEFQGQYLLHYYKDHTRRTLKGTIFLDECEQVDIGLTVGNGKQKYENMFNIKTSKRVYYLAVDTSDEMTTWVRYVCTVCGLKSFLEEDEEKTNILSDPSRVSSSYSLMSKTSSTPSISSPYILISECISGTPSTGAYVNAVRSSSEGDKKNDFCLELEEGDDSVFEAGGGIVPSRPPKPPHLVSVSENSKSFPPPDVSRELKPGRKRSDPGRSISTRFKTMGPPVPRTLKPCTSSFSATMPRQWTHHSADEASNSDSGSRRNSSQDEQIYFYMPRLGPPGNYSTVMIPAESFENKSVAYIDLELPDPSSTPKPTPPSGASTTVYKTVDFIKTDAFNRTRENVLAKYDDAQLQQKA